MSHPHDSETGLETGRKALSVESEKTTGTRLLKTGVIGTGIAALCCFTPVLAVLFGVVGLSAVLGWIDYVLLPALAFFIGLTIYAIWRRNRGMAPD